MTKTNDDKFYEGMRRALPSDLKPGTRVWYKAANKANTRWWIVAQTSRDGGATELVAEPGIVGGIWAYCKDLWLPRPRVMFRVIKKTGEVIIILLDTARHPDTAVTGDQYGVGAEIVDYYKPHSNPTILQNVMVNTPYQSLIGRTRGLQNNGERNRAQVLLRALEAETKISYRVKTRR